MKNLLCAILHMKELLCAAFREWLSETERYKGATLGPWMAEKSPHEIAIASALREESQKAADAMLERCAREDQAVFSSFQRWSKEQIEALQKERDTLRQHLGNLLARIRRTLHRPTRAGKSRN